MSIKQSGRWDLPSPTFLIDETFPDLVLPVLVSVAVYLYKNILVLTLRVNLVHAAISCNQ